MFNRSKTSYILPKPKQFLASFNNDRELLIQPVILRFDKIYSDFYSDQYNETQFLPSSGRADTAKWMHYMDANKTDGEKAWRQLHTNAASNIQPVLEATRDKVAGVQPLTTDLENYQN